MVFPMCSHECLIFLFCFDGFLSVVFVSWLFMKLFFFFSFFVFVAWSSLVSEYAFGSFLPCLFFNSKEKKEERRTLADKTLQSSREGICTNEDWEKTLAIKDIGYTYMMCENV